MTDEEKEKLHAVKKVVRRMFNPTPLSEVQVKEEAEHLMWALDLYGYEIVPKLSD